MSREPYIHPPLLAREPLPRWVAVWRFRIVAGVLLLVLAAGLVTVLQRVSGAGTEQSPTFHPLRAPGAVSVFTPAGR